MRSHRLYVGVLFAVILLPCTLFAEEQYARFPSIGVELLQPEGFAVSKRWQGLEGEATGSGVVLSTLPVPSSEVTVGFTPDRLKAKGMTLGEKSDVTIAGKPAVLLSLNQTMEGVEVGKWLAVFGEKSTTMIVASYPKQLEAEMGPLLKSVVTGARPIEARRAPVGGDVDFELGRGEWLRLASAQNGTLIYTADGTVPQKSPKDPLLVVAKSLGAPPIANLEQFAIQRLHQTAETKITRVESNRPSKYGRYQVCDTVAMGEDNSSGEPLVVLQKIIVDHDCYFIFQGLAGAQHRPRFQTEFQNITRGFRRTNEGERRAFTAVDSSRKENDLQRLARMKEEVRKPRPIRRAVSEPPRAFEPHDIPDDRPKEIEQSVRDNEARVDARGARAKRESSPRVARARPVKLPKPKSPLPRFEYSANAIKLSSELGSANGEHFKAVAPSGGLLVGLSVVRGTDFGGAVRGLEPIFQIADHYQRGGLHGHPGDDVKLLLAPPGYAVGGVQVGAGAWMDAVRLVFTRIDGNRLDTTKPEYSEWVGGNGGSARQVLSDGSPMVGLAGTFQENCQSIELMYVSPQDLKVAAPAKSPAPDTGTAGSAVRVRTWKSANGKFSVAAKLEASDGKQVTLLKGDGKKVTVPIDKLSPEDQEYVKQSNSVRAEGE
jgi:hypothetical protein